MNLQEIINKPNSEEFTVAELHFVIEQYIADKKGIRIKLNYPSLWFLVATSPGFKLHQEAQIRAHLVKINEAFSIAQKYFKDKKV